MLMLYIFSWFSAYALFILLVSIGTTLVYLRVLRVRRETLS